MIKGLLIIFTAGAVSYFGLLKVYKMNKRCAVLKELSSVFSYIAEYVNLYRVSQREAFEKVSKMPCYKELDIFSKVNGNEIDISKSSLNDFLTEEDFSYMHSFFEECENFDLDTYLKNCNNLSVEYHNLYKKANDEKIEKEKLYTSLSILGGLFVIVVLI